MRSAFIAFTALGLSCAVGSVNAIGSVSVVGAPGGATRGSVDRATVFPRAHWKTRTAAAVDLDGGKLDAFVGKVGGRGVIPHPLGHPRRGRSGAGNVRLEEPGGYGSIAAAG